MIRLAHPSGMEGEPSGSLTVRTARSMAAKCAGAHGPGTDAHCIPRFFVLHVLVSQPACGVFTAHEPIDVMPVVPIAELPYLVHDHAVGGRVGEEAVAHALHVAEITQGDHVEAGADMVGHGHHTVAGHVLVVDAPIAVWGIGGIEREGAAPVHGAVVPVSRREGAVAEVERG